MVTKTAVTAQEQSPTDGKPAEPAFRRALLLELEGMAVATRRFTFETLKKGLADTDAEFTEATFMRYGLHAVPEHMVNDLAAHLGLKASLRTSLLGKVSKTLAEYFASSKVELAPGLEKLLTAAAAQGVTTGVISWQPEEAAKALVEKLGLGRWNVRLCAFAEIDHEFPGADVWLKSVKQLGCYPRNTVALVGARASCRAALAAGMRCVVAPDAFTSFQDFGGADVVADSLAELDAKVLLG